jgi:hypothetical protein
MRDSPVFLTTMVYIADCPAWIVASADVRVLVTDNPGSAVAASTAINCHASAAVRATESSAKRAATRGGRGELSARATPVLAIVPPVP